MSVLLTFVTCLTIFCISALASGREVTRDYFGDVFRMRGCIPKNASRCDKGGARLALEIPGKPCYCQCAPSHFTYREDKADCIKDVRECYMSVFYRPFAVEAIPLVFLPTSGQLVHPDAHLSLAGRRRPATNDLPRCKATVSQYMTRAGWRTITRDEGGAIFTLFQDGNKTFLQFVGSEQDRHMLQQHLVLIRMFCKIPEFSPFETCVAVRVGWSPGVEPLQSGENSGTRANMMVIGLSLGVLGMVYVLAVLIYLKFRRKNRLRKINGLIKQQGDRNCPESGNTLDGLDPTKRLELYHTHSLGRQKPSRLRDNAWKSLSQNETFSLRNCTERPTQLGCEFSVQEFQLRPEHFEPEALASPPQPVMDYLQRLQDSMTFARHRLRVCYRYQPTLLGIPEDDYFYQEDIERATDENDERRTTPDGISSSSNASTSGKPNVEVCPKRPPRKTRSSKLAESSVCSQCVHSSKTEHEETTEEIKTAMDALNDTLDAIEYDIFKQELLGKGDVKSRGIRAVETSSLKREKRHIATQVTDDESEVKDFDSSTCSSTSVVTVLGKEKRLPPFNRGIFRQNKSAVRTQCETLESCKSKHFKYLDLPEPTPSSRVCKKSKASFSSFALGRKHELDRHDVETLPYQKTRTCARTFSDGHSNDTEYETEQTDCTDTDLTDLSVSDCGCSNPHSFNQKSGHEGGKRSPNTTSDSLESSLENDAQLTLMDLWINRLVSGSPPRCKHGRKSKKKSKSSDGWVHVCEKKKRDPCPVHDLSDGSALLDRFVNNNNSDTTPDISSYFQSLKHDVLLEHIKGWLTTQNQNRKPKLGVSGMRRGRNRIKSVPSADTSSVIADSGFHSSCSSFTMTKRAESPPEDSQCDFGRYKTDLQYSDFSDSESGVTIADQTDEILNLPESDNEMVLVATK